MQVIGSCEHAEQLDFVLEPGGLHLSEIRFIYFFSGVLNVTPSAGHIAYLLSFFFLFFFSFFGESETAKTRSPTYTGEPENH